MPIQTFAEFAAESFRSEVALTWQLSGLKKAIATFYVDAIRVDVVFEQREQGGPWHVLFETESGKENASDRAVHAAFEIFNGVFQAAQEFIETRAPEVVVFATKKDKLASIYVTYLRRERDTLEKLGYRLGDAERVYPFVEYRLTRIQASDWK